MTWSKEFRDFVFDQLVTLGDVRARAMFGGVGIYSETVMFGLVADDQLYFRVDELSRARFWKWVRHRLAMRDAARLPAG